MFYEGAVGMGKPRLPPFKEKSIYAIEKIFLIDNIFCKLQMYAKMRYAPGFLTDLIRNIMNDNPTTPYCFHVILPIFVHIHSK